MRRAGPVSRYAWRRASRPRASLPPAAVAQWVVGTRTFVQGSSDTSDIQPSGPSDYTGGGVYGVDPTGTPLPNGMTLSDAGVLFVGSATAQTTSGVVFSYHEPGALPTLTLHSTSAGTFPYMATVYPVEGAVPSGLSLTSPDDLNLRGSVLSAWPDGSAQVMVVAGQKTVGASSQAPVRLRVETPSGTALTTSDIASKFTTGIAFTNFGGGTQTLNTWTSPDFIWWQNPQVICARYRQSLNIGALEAVIDVHAFAGGRAFVEVVIENGKINASAATVTAPASRTYTNATVSVNGTTIATVSSPTVGMQAPNRRATATYQGDHEAFRAWYCAAEVVGTSASPVTNHYSLFGIEVTHDTTSLQAHPWFFEPAELSTENMQTKYGQTYDAYVPWATCRLRVPGMGAGGDDEQIAFLTEEQSDYVITGSKFARRAAIATGLACHSMNWNYRHDGTGGNPGRIPTRAQMTGKNQGGNLKWPANDNEPCWDTTGSHTPFIGVVPFLCRPSPCFIEIAQKEFCWNATHYGSLDAGGHSYDEVRARAWRLRNYAGAIWLTPDADYDGTGRKASLRTALAINIPLHNQFLDQSWNTLKVFYGHEYNSPETWLLPRTSNFMNNFCVISFGKIESLKVLRGTDQTDWTAMCEKFCTKPLRHTLQGTAGEWRAVTYRQYTGTQVAGPAIDMGIGDFAERNRIDYGSSVPASTGPWLSDPDADGTRTDWSQLSVLNTTPNWNGGSYNYDAIHWAALVVAVERGGADADSAWSKVTTGITNLGTWKQGFRSYPRFNYWPRNK